MGRTSTSAVFVILLMGPVLLALFGSSAAAAAPGRPSAPVPKLNGQGTHEVVADPRRPLIYQVDPGNGFLVFRNASTGALRPNETLAVGPSPTSIDFSADGNFLYVAVSGANRTVVVNIDARTVVRTIPLGFSPFSVRHGRPDRLYASGKGDSFVRVVNETTGAVITSFEPYHPYEVLLDASPNGTELLAHTHAGGIISFRYSVKTDTPVLVLRDNGVEGDPEKLIVDWSGRMMYVSSQVPYSVKRLSLDTLTVVQEYRTSAYAAGVALLPQRHLVFGLNSYPYGGALWAFNLTNGSLARRVPMGTELSFVVASPFTETVLVWSPYGVQAVSLAPTVTPLNPAPGTTVTQYPWYVNARVWTGIPVVTIDRAQIHVNGRPLQTSFSSLDVISGYSIPPVPIGTWNIRAEVAWGTGSTSATWTATVAPPSPIAGWYQHPRDPLFVGQTIRFDAGSSVSREGHIIAYEWNLGDGSNASGAKVDFAYRQAGEFIVNLTVRTDIGDSSTASTRLVVGTFPNIPLTPYTNPAGFRIPGPASWNVSENVPIGSSVVEVVFRGPTYQSGPTTVAVDARRDSAANESAAYLSGRVDVVVNELRQLGGILTVTEPAAPRTIACHEGRTFVAVDTYRGIAYKVALVVSAAHGRWWMILLTVDPDYLSVYEPMFNSMVDGFEVTLGSGCAPALSGGPVIVVAAAGGVTAGVAGGIWWTLRARRKRRGPTESRTSEEKPQP
jgi:hypothetical protein